ncbi:AMP-binding protein [Herbiconiux sp. CPCC 203407]|uniref:AMP-binding protein n=1 Tax=Herbiconiux oxytropis TaxID=2970915 RepID=A0AA42BTI6_9MICO|nr:AMP-binding protein [Herbiconiux oxytropis]MCS5724247.1 AMP-binding protein [Herbiconiux oxytropis]MCS5725902.1 AMP-binding protein [Herbiconiux oxytropis]
MTHARPGQSDVGPSDAGLTARVDELVEADATAAAVIEVGDRPATLSRGELRRRADAVSALLLRLGVRPGEAVAFQLPNWAECVEVTLGVLQIGAVVAPVMPVFGEREVAMVLARSRARVLIAPRSFRGRRHAAEVAGVAAEAARQERPLALEHVVVMGDVDPAGAARAGSSGEGVTFVPPATPGLPLAWHDFDTDAAPDATPDAASREAIERRRPGADDIAQLLFTSGTTGEPKGVQHRHGTLALATALEVEHLGLGGDDRVFIPSPLAHQTGFLYGLLLSWRLGVAAVVQPVWDARVALEQAFGRKGATFVQAATPFLMDVVAAVEEGAPPPSSLRIFVATGAAVPRQLAERATGVLGAAVLGAFGTTETCLGTLSAPTDPPGSAWGTDGRPLTGIRVRIVDDEGVELPAGREGDYELSSPTMFLGYLDRPDLTAEVFTADGWYRTGDRAVLDADGFLHITGRVKDVINRGGEKVPVVEIENLLFAHSAVKDVAVVAMPDPRLGERACAFVVASDPAHPLGFAEMQGYLGERGVSKYYWPERLEAIGELPRNAVGKIQKNLLRERAAALVERERQKESA